MEFEKPVRLERDVNITAYNRPIKIAFIAPFTESGDNHLILDGIFEFSYMCWGGTRHIILPSDGNDFQDKHFGKWLSVYDADYIYSYVSLSDDFIRKIETICSPSALIEHDFDIRGRTVYKPNFQFQTAPLGSISIAHSPFLRSSGFLLESQKPLRLISQHSRDNSDRFISDNFGCQLSQHQVLHEIPGLFETLCLTPDDIPEHIVTGTKRANSIVHILNELRDRNVTPVSRLATLHSDYVTASNIPGITRSFTIFIGDTVEDRLNFWNARSLYEERNACLCVMIITESQFDSEDFVESLGKYLNKNNYIGDGNHSVSLRSTSKDRKEIEEIKNRLQEHTYNSVFIYEDYGRRARPNESELKHNFSRAYLDSYAFKVSETRSKTTPQRPSHLKYISHRYEAHGNGEWCFEAEIERHNNLSRYSNVIDVWKLPRRSYISKMFGNQCRRISKHYLPVFFVSKNQEAIAITPTHSKGVVEISLPEDDVALSMLISQRGNHHESDKRHTLFDSKVKYVRASDKGKNFNGVISMFDNLSSAASYLTNKLWRDILSSEINSTEDKIFEAGHLSGLIPNDKKFKKLIADELRLKSTKQANKYLKACFLDALDELVHRNVFYPVHTWNCSYCGHKNSRTVDKLKKVNQCDICNTNNTIPVGDEFRWKYLLNTFVSKTLHNDSGMPVLWSLNRIQDISIGNSFFYLPEIDLYYDFYDKNQKNEIDFAGISDGSFYVGEAKRSADYFLSKENEKEKFETVIKYVAPDIAILAFEQYSEDGESVEDIKAKLNDYMKKFETEEYSHISFRCMVAEDDKAYSEYGHDFGGIGDRVLRIYREWDKESSA